jgi:hypothetical protein
MCAPVWVLSSEILGLMGERFVLDLLCVGIRV